MENKKQISFIIPIYNVNITYLEECINSIENQMRYDDEIILINDGSLNEEIDKYCKKRCSKNNNIIYFYQQNSGVSSARNNGIKNAKGKYIFFVDADDKINSDFIKRFSELRLMEQEIVVFDYCFLYTNGEEIKTLYNERKLADEKEQLMSNILYNPYMYDNFMMGAVWSKCFLREFLIKNNIEFKKELPNAEDRLFMLEAFEKAENIEYNPIFCYKYRLNIESVSHNINFKVVEYYKDFYKYVKDFLEDSKYDNLKVRKYLEYNIINEILPLLYFNINYKEKYFEKRKKVLNLFKEFDLYKYLKYIKIKDIITLKGKIKLFCFKKRLILILNIIFSCKQKKELKKMKKEG